MKVGGGRKPPPPEDKAAGWGGSGERVRDGPHDRARRVHAPCKPQRGDHRGCERRVGRATTGATRHAPPPPLQRDQCRASCLRRACDVLTPVDRQRGRPPTPPPTPPPTRKRGEDSEETARGHGGGQRTDRNAEGRGGRRAVETPGSKKKKQSKPTRQSRDRQCNRTQSKDR